MLRNTIRKILVIGIIVNICLFFIFISSTETKQSNQCRSYHCENGLHPHMDFDTGDCLCLPVPKELQ